jgi:hypothetical protein
MREICDTIVTALVGDANVTGWWNSCNAAFDMHTAADMFDQDPRRVYYYLHKQLDYLI